MSECRRASSARQDEFLEWTEGVVELNDMFFEADDVCIIDDVRSGDAQFASKIEKVMLNPK